MHNVIKLGLTLVITILTLACTEDAALTPDSAAAELTRCADERPQMCTFEYRPVCGQRDTGIRCVTTPCPSSEWKTYPNACAACADKKVSGHLSGECKNAGKAYN